MAVGKEDPLGTGRAPQDQGKALASASTLNRLELGNNKKTGYHRISANHEAIQGTLLRKGVSCLPKHSKEVVIDLDASDDPLHRPAGRTFLSRLLWLLLLSASLCLCRLSSAISRLAHPAAMRPEGAWRALGKDDARAIRKRCPKAQIIVRADSGFCREEIMAWCEAQPPKVY